VSETKQVPGQALLELFDSAAKAYAYIAELATLAPSWDNQKTIEELAFTVLRAAEDVGVLSYVRSIIKFYMTSSTVAGKDYDARKVRLLLRTAKGLVRLAERIKASVPSTHNRYEPSNDVIAREFAKDLVSRGNPMGFYKSAHGLFRRLLERSREMLREGSDNLVLIGILPRRRVLEYFEEGLEDLAADKDQLPEAIDKDKAEGD
jgi:hypothetical protein